MTSRRWEYSTSFINHSVRRTYVLVSTILHLRTWRQVSFTCRRGRSPPFVLPGKSPRLPCPKGSCGSSVGKTERCRVPSRLRLSASQGYTYQEKYMNGDFK